MVQLYNNTSMISAQKNSCFILSVYHKDVSLGGDRGVMVIVVGIGQDDTSSNPGRD